MRIALKVINCSTHPEEVNFFVIDKFPAVPQKGDRVDASEMVKEFCDAETAASLEQLTWFVDHIFWCQDEKGIYPEIVCKCSEQPAPAQ